MSFWSDVGNNLASCITSIVGALFIISAILVFFFMQNTILAIILFVIGVVLIAMSAAFSKKARR